MALKNIKWPSNSGEKSANNLPSAQEKPHSGKVKWRTILGLLLMYVAIALNWQWIWGLFSLYWIIPDFFTGVTYFIEPISRQEEPILYWLIMITWVAFSVAMILPSFS
ncbi:MAG: hypothetical protein F6J93_28550 [Oscillatoria sp. SIO1A7]|nr:hypothetical protein [Oscillatoria sp. SIO1A7]